MEMPAFAGKTINANVATINETNLKGNRKMKIEGYTSYNRNRLNANMGGVATCVAVREASNVLKVAEGVNDDEYIITRHGQLKTPINLSTFSTFMGRLSPGNLRTISRKDGIGS